jgi:hypothetical protein
VHLDPWLSYIQPLSTVTHMHRTCPCCYTVRSLIKLKATVTSQLLAGTAWLTTKCYKVFPIQDKNHSTKTIKSTYLFFYSTSCWEPGSDSCLQLYQWTQCTYETVVLPQCSIILSLFSRNMVRLQYRQLPSPATIFTENVYIFQHRVKTLPNFQNYKCEPLQTNCNLL